MGLLILLVLSSWRIAGATLTISEFRVTPATGAPSCGLLRQRELERAKVLRELAQLRAERGAGDQRALLQANGLLLNKFFLDRSTWSDATAFVDYDAAISEDLAQTIARSGLGAVFLKFYGPGLTWQSYADQVPSDLELRLDAANRRLHVHYPIYQANLCFGPRLAPTLDWIPGERTDSPLPNVANTAEQVSALLKAMAL